MSQMPPPLPPPTLPPGQRQNRFQRRNNRLELWVAMAAGLLAVIGWAIIR